MAFIVEVKPPWNVGEGEPGFEDWAPCYYPSGDQNPELSTVETDVEARMLEHQIRWYLLTSMGNENRLVRIREL